MTQKELYSEPILNVVNSVGETMMLPQTVVCAVIIDTLVYRASKRVTKDVQAAVKAVLHYNNPEQPTQETAAKMLKIAKRINDFWLEQCDEIKQLFLDLTARRYTEIAIMHKQAPNSRLTPSDGKFYLRREKGRQKRNKQAKTIKI